MNDPTSPAIPLGVIADRYELLSIVGRGGAGLVYSARDRVLGETLALKVLPVGRTDPEEMDRVKREIITARKITHPNVIRIHEFGLAGSDAWISMELLTGGTLAQRLRAGPLTLREAREIAIGICEGLAAAHAEGIVHRDLKPENILFDDHGRPKIVDFGLARLASAGGSTRGFSGTPLYMSPEQVDGREVTQQSDVYSLGVMLYEMFTGSVPFVGENIVQLALLHAKATPAAPRTLRPEIPPSLEGVLLHALEKDPQKRSTAQKIAEDLRGEVHGQQPVPVRLGTVPLVSRRRPQTAPMWGGLMALGIAGIGATALGYSWIAKPPPAPTSAIATAPLATPAPSIPATHAASSPSTRPSSTTSPLPTPTAIPSPTSAPTGAAYPPVAFDESTLEYRGQTVRRRIPRYPASFLAGCEASELADMDSSIIIAIHEGAAAYNGGDIAGCAQTYLDAAAFIRTQLGEACAGPRAGLQRVIDRAPGLHTPVEKAWALRDEFDGLQRVIHSHKP